MILADSFDVTEAAACSALMFVFIPNPEKTETTNNVLRDMTEGFQAIHSNRGLKWVMIIEILNKWLTLLTNTFLKAFF